MKRYGFVKEKTYKEVQDYVINDNGVTVFTRDMQSNINGEFYIDLVDLEEVLKNAWRMNALGYIQSNRTRTNEKPITIHRLIMNASDDEIVDHIDRNPSNNKRNNLRIVTQYENMMNSSVSKVNKSGYKGVFYNKTTDRWDVRITVRGKKINLGSYKIKDDAIKVRLEAEMKYQGEYSINYENIIKDDEIG